MDQGVFDKEIKLAEAAFPEIEWIGNVEWKRIVAEIWAKAFKDSKWERLKDAQYNPLCPGISLVDHTRAVTRAAVEMARCFASIFGEKVNVSQDVLVTASLLHDVCKLIEYEPGEHGAVKGKIGSSFQHGFLSGYYALEAGLPPEVVSIIISHTGESRSVPRSPEGILLYYADMADADVHRSSARAPLLLEKGK